MAALKFKMSEIRPANETPKTAPNTAGSELNQLSESVETKLEVQNIFAEFKNWILDQLASESPEWDLLEKCPENCREALPEILQNIEKEMQSRLEKNEAIWSLPEIGMKIGTEIEASLNRFQKAFFDPAEVRDFLDLAIANPAEAEIENQDFLNLLQKYHEKVSQYNSGKISGLNGIRID